MRINRTTQKGTSYASSFGEEPKPETLEALDAVADAAREMMEAEQEARAWVQSEEGSEFMNQRGGLLTATQLQRVQRIGFNMAARVLERLERDGELVRIPAAAMTWALAPKATPSRGYVLPLSPKEHGALLRLLDKYLGDWQRPEDSAADLRALRAIRSRMKRPA